MNNQRFGTPFRRIENPEQFDQHDLLWIFNVTRLGVGEQIFFSKGFADHGDIHHIESNELGCNRFIRHGWELDHTFHENILANNCGINWKNLSEEEEYQLTVDTISMLCMGGEL